jgi:hypothetical protein
MFTLNVDKLPLVNVKFLVPLSNDAVIKADDVNWFNAATDAAEPDASNVAIFAFQLALSALYETSSTNESIISVLKSLSIAGVIAPALLFGNDWLLSTFKACLVNSAIL